MTLCPEVADLRKQHSYTASESEHITLERRVINISQLDSESEKSGYTKLLVCCWN